LINLRRCRGELLAKLFGPTQHLGSVLFIFDQMPKPFAVARNEKTSFLPGEHVTVVVALVYDVRQLLPVPVRIAGTFEVTIDRVAVFLVPSCSVYLAMAKGTRHHDGSGADAT